MRVRLASVAWKIRTPRSDSKYFAHFYDLVSEAHDEGAEVVVFPELHCLELLPLARDLETKDAAKYLVQYGKALEEWIGRISKSSGMTIIGGSHFIEFDEQIRNVCVTGLPDGQTIRAEKNNLTVYERDFWKLQKGSGLVQLPNKLGITICYDCEFPRASRVLSNAGTMVQCVPYWTETQRGFQRVRWSCLARAVENQIYVVHSSLVGALGYEPVPTTYGSAAIIAPSVEPFPVEAILRETPLNEEGVIFADLDYDLLIEARSQGEVTNWLDRDSGDWRVTTVQPDGSSTKPFNVNGELN